MCHPKGGCQRFTGVFARRSDENALIFALVGQVPAETGVLLITISAGPG